MSMIFPDGAIEYEREFEWAKIGEIEDADFGLRELKEKTNKARFCVRVLIFYDKNEVCVIRSEKFGYVQIPGGGIEEGECITEALLREAWEETGFLIECVKPVGYTIEKRESVENIQDWDRSISFVFKAKPEKFVGVEYTDEEKAEEFNPVWMKLEDFILTLKEQEENPKISNYSGRFSVRRDLKIAEYIAQTII